MITVETLTINTHIIRLGTQRIGCSKQIGKIEKSYPGIRVE